MNPYGISTAPAVDLIAIARWNADNRRSIETYFAEHATSVGIDYRARAAASEKQIRYRARKKEQSK